MRGENNKFLHPFHDAMKGQNLGQAKLLMELTSNKPQTTQLS